MRAAGKALTKQLQNAPGVLTASSYWSLGEVPQLAQPRPDARRSSSRRCGAIDDDKLKIAGRALAPVQPARPGRHHRRRPGVAEVTRQLVEPGRARTSTGPTSSRAPFTFVALVLVFGSTGRRVAAARGRAPRGARHLRGAHAARQAHDRLGLLAQPRDRSRPRSLDRLQPVRRLPLPRGARCGASSPPVAIGRSMQTAGRTVAFSAGTVAISLMSLVVFPVPYLRSFAYAGVAVVALAAVAAIVVLPAVLAVLGPRVEKFRVFKARDVTDGGFWRHQAERVMRHPVPYAVGGQPRAAAARDPVLPLQPGSLRRPGRTEEHEQPRSRPIRSASTSRAGRPTRSSVQVPDVDAEGQQGGNRHLRHAGSPACRVSHASTRSPASTCVRRASTVAYRSRRLRRLESGSDRRRGSGARTSRSFPTSSRCRAGASSSSTSLRGVRAPFEFLVAGTVGAARRHQAGGHQPPAAGARRSSRSQRSCCCS